MNIKQRIVETPTSVTTPDPPDNANGLAQLPRLLRLPAVCGLTGLSRSGIYQREKDGTFPNRVAIGPHSVAWREAEIVTWIETRQLKAEI